MAPAKKSKSAPETGSPETDSSWDLLARRQRAVNAAVRALSNARLVMKNARIATRDSNAFSDAQVSHLKKKLAEILDLERLGVEEDPAESFPTY